MEVSDQLHVPTALPPGEIPPGTHWIGGWVGAVEKRKILHYREWNLGRSARRYTDRAVVV
jgi:hypothetical protein